MIYLSSSELSESTHIADTPFIMSSKKGSSTYRCCSSFVYKKSIFC